MPVSPLDFVLLQFGSPGHYQAFLGFLLCCLQLPIILTTHLFTFYTFTPPHRCLIPSTRFARLAGSDGRGYTIAKNEWYPILPSSSVASASLAWSRPGMEEMLLLRTANTSSPLPDPCNVYIDPVHHWKGTQSCPSGWEYWTPNEEVSLVTEFNLVCESRPYLAGLVVATSVAAFTGAAAFGWLADSWGRTKALHLSLYLFVASSLSAYFSTYFIQLAVFYTLQVFFVRGLEISAFVLLLELLPSPYHLRASILWLIFGTLTSSLCHTLLVVLPSWRSLQLSIAVPSFAFFLYIFVLPASPLWLTVVKADLGKALKTLAQFGKFNGKPLCPNQLSQHVHNLYQSATQIVCRTSSISVADANPLGSSSTATPHEHKQIPAQVRLSRPGPILRWYLLTHFYLFFVVGILGSHFVGMNSLLLHRDDNLNSLYNSFLDLGIMILAYHLALCLGGRIMQCLLFMLTGLLLLGSIGLKEYCKSKLNAEFEDKSFDYRLTLVPPFLMLIARSLATSLVAFTWFHAAKTIPTSRRATGLGFCFFWAQVAQLSVPHLIILDKYLPSHLLLTLLALLSLLASTLTLLFPSLCHAPLPNTLDDLMFSNSTTSSFTSCKSSLPSLSSSLGRYPSYRDLRKTDTKKVQSQSTSAGSAYNVYTVSPVSFSQPNSMRIRQQQDNVRSPYNSLKSNVNLLSSGRGPQGTETTSDTSLSSNSPPGGVSLPRGYYGQSLEQGFIPSTSYSVVPVEVHATTNRTQLPQHSSYINFGAEETDDSDDMLPIELNNELTVLDSVSQFGVAHFEPRNTSNLLEETLIKNFHRPVGGGSVGRATKLKTIQV